MLDSDADPAGSPSAHHTPDRQPPTPAADKRALFSRQLKDLAGSTLCHNSALFHQHQMIGLPVLVSIYVPRSNGME